MTISETEIERLDAPNTVPREAAEKVLNYLVFHRSLLGETEDTPVLLERYLSLVEKLKEWVHVVIPDPFQKAMALLFELVMEEEFDPWEIDLVKFTQSYLDRMRSAGEVDFAIAGRLLYMAWSILYLQSEALLKLRSLPEAAEASADGLGAGGDDYFPFLETPEAVDVTTAVLGSTDPPPLLEMVRHPETRPVTLLELVRAFGEAEVDARRALRIQELRERLRDEQRAPPEVLVHGDIPQQDLDDTWQAALAHPVGAPFPFLELWNPLQGRDRLVAVFLSVLFLAREKAIELRQDVLMESPILVVRTAETRQTVPEAA